MAANNKTISISDVRKEISHIVASGEQVTVTSRNLPVLEILPHDLYESIMETLEIAMDPNAMKALWNYASVLESGAPLKTIAIDDVAKQLGLEEADRIV